MVQLHIEVLEARDLAPKDSNGLADPVCCTLYDVDQIDELTI
jgi:hypothetical protein